MELHNELRPRTLKYVVGQPNAVRVLDEWVKAKTVPHVILFDGPSGVGKTTLARIVAKYLKCVEIKEINCASDRGMDTARDIIDQGLYAPLGEGPRAFVLDEVVQLPKQTQQALLTTLEEPKSWNYYFLCTTETTGLVRAFLGRCKRITLRPIEYEVIKNYLLEVVEMKNLPVQEGIIGRIASRAGGSLRHALGMLEKAAAGATDFDRDDEEEDTRRLCQALLKREMWPKTYQIAVSLKDNPEGVRLQVLAYMAKALENAPRASLIIDQFQYDFSQSGKAGLLNACWKVFCQKLA